MYHAEKFMEFNTQSQLHEVARATHIFLDPRTEQEYMGEPSKSTVTWTEGFLVTIVITSALLALVANATTGNAPTEHKTGAHGAKTTGSTEPLTNTLDWPPLAIDAGALARAREEYHGNQAAMLAKPENKHLLDVVRSHNDHQFVTAPIPTKTGQQLNDELAYALSDVLTLVDPRVGFVPLGKPLFDQCEQGIDQLLGDIQSKKLTLEKAKVDPPFDRYPLYRRNCGNMLGEFMARGLIDDNAKWASEDARHLGRILQRYRWASLMRLHTEALKQLPPLEREIFARWRVQARDAYPIEKRREYLGALETYAPDFPKGLAMALLEYDAGRKEKAAEILSRYHNQNPADPTYKALYQQITEELAKSPKK